MKHHRGRAIVFGIAVVGVGGCDGSAGGAAEETCLTGSACGRVELIDASAGGCSTGKDQLYVVSEYVDAAQCLLEALRDGTPGRYFVIRTNPDGEGTGFCGADQRIQIVGDRAAIVFQTAYWDLDYSESDALDAELRSPDHYQKCLDDGPDAYAPCLVSPVVVMDGSPSCTCDYCEFTSL